MQELEITLPVGAAGTREVGVRAAGVREVGVKQGCDGDQMMFGLGLGRGIRFVGKRELRPRKIGRFLGDRIESVFEYWISTLNFY